MSGANYLVMGMGVWYVYLYVFHSGSLPFTDSMRTCLNCSKKDTFSHPKYHSCMHFNLSNEDTSLTTTLSSVPLVSGLERFHCTLLLDSLCIAGIGVQCSWVGKWLVRYDMPHKVKEFSNSQ